MCKRNIQILNDLEFLPAVHDCVDQLAGQVDMPDTDIYQFKMALEEVIVNIISYAYPEQDGMPIDISFDFGKEICSVVVTDSGIPFNPTLDAESPDFDLSVSDMPIGGIGVYLTKMYMQKMDYQRTDDGKNVLSLEYRIGTEPACDIDIMSL